MNKELLDYFDFSTETPSVSAFTQQRAKVLPDMFDFVIRGKDIYRNGIATAQTPVL